MASFSFIRGANFQSFGPGGPQAPAGPPAGPTAGPAGPGPAPGPAGPSEARLLFSSFKTLLLRSRRQKLRRKSHKAQHGRRSPRPVLLMRLEVVQEGDAELETHSESLFSKFQGTNRRSPRRKKKCCPGHRRQYRDCVRLGHMDIMKEQKSGPTKLL